MMWLYRSSCRFNFYNSIQSALSVRYGLPLGAFRNALSRLDNYASIQEVLYDGLNKQVGKDQQEAVLNKYANKLKQHMQMDDVSSLEDLKKAISLKASKKQEVLSSKVSPTAVNQDSKVLPSPSEYVSGNAEASSALPRSLNDILNVEMLKSSKITVDNIEHIWQSYHLEKYNERSVSAVIPSETYATLQSRATQNPMFLFPLPRNEGFEFFLFQFSFNRALFTPLIEYQTHGENAKPYLILQHFTELSSSKKVVLMQGILDIASSSASYKKTLISIEDARMLANLLQYYYILAPASRFTFVQQFNQSPEKFDYKAFLEDFKSISLS